ncbi:hypothetical protein [Paenarthrobacter sp. PH39-S1]|uniref:hypothetical protein n=1 Tax=Paenarthrobacter sp. PH39-S1 TaxID=3046204 RepID=UPI0024B8D01F|nr:hypothetical protein [Paenarthrobacter sp. PH39-S1]MDJ0356645.1 hypothetical protein [Paenarthrobacter sp. PH39-S1]
MIELGGCMFWDWGDIGQTTDNVIIIAGIAVLIFRQFIWRSAELHRMLRLPMIIIAVGITYLIVELWGGFHWVPGDWLIIGELALVSITGTAMGYVTRFRTVDGHLQYRLTAAGIGLWAAFIAIRVGSFVLASMLGANLTDATGLILLSFGVNRLAAITVVRRRVQQILVTLSGAIIS